MSTLRPKLTKRTLAGLLALVCAEITMSTPKTSAKTAAPVDSLAHPTTMTQPARIGPNFGAPSLAFVDHQLGQLTETGLVLWDMNKMVRERRIPLKNPRGLGTLNDGSFLALGAPEPGHISVVHIPHGGHTVKTYPATLGSDLSSLSRILARGAQQFWVLVPGADPSLNSFKLALLEGELELLDSRPLNAAAARNLSALAGGEIGYLEGGILHVLSTSERTYQLPAEASGAVFLAGGPGKDRVVVAGERGPLYVVGLAGPAATIERKMEIGGALIHSLDSNGGRVAVLLVDYTPPMAAHWSVVVFASDGKELLRRDVPSLPARAPATPHFVRLSSSGLLALGNQSHLLVMDIATGKERLRDGAIDNPK